MKEKIRREWIEEYRNLIDNYNFENNYDVEIRCFIYETKYLLTTIIYNGIKYNEYLIKLSTLKHMNVKSYFDFITSYIG